MLLPRLNQRMKRVHIVHAIHRKVQRIVYNLSKKEIAGVRLHLLEISMSQSRRHNPGSLRMSFVSFFSRRLSRGQIESEHIEMMLKTADELFGHRFKIDFAPLSGIRLVCHKKEASGALLPARRNKKQSAVSRNVLDALEVELQLTAMLPPP